MAISPLILTGCTPLNIDHEPIAGEKPLMSVLSRLNTDSLLVRLLFRSILPLLHVDNALLFSYKFQINCIAFCTEFVQCTVCSSMEYAYSWYILHGGSL